MRRRESWSMPSIQRDLALIGAGIIGAAALIGAGIGVAIDVAIHRHRAV